MSFVSTPQDVARIGERLKKAGRPDFGMIVKLETRGAIRNLAAILFEALKYDSVGLMIARGDLAVELSFERLAEMQEEILWFGEACHLPVIWATQVLDSVTHTGLPTRAEVTDAAMAMRAECVMLNKGLHIGAAVRMLADIIRKMETHQYRKRYNVDKALLVAGQCSKDFGWGWVRQPMELVLGDRATFGVDGAALPVEGTVRGAVDRWIAAHLPNVRAGKDLEVRLALAPGSEELRAIYAARSGPVVSNDTSGASGYAPLSPTETLVLAIEGHLNGPSFKSHFPDTGQDVKVFAFRDGDTVDVTVAMPLLSRLTSSEAAYFQRKDAILSDLATRFAGEPLAVRWALNALDRPGRGAGGAYLSVTGTSAEDADSGQVGRGNRANGLIAFARPTGGEAAAGKNPVAHAGKIYSVFSHHLAQRLYARCPGLAEVYVHLAAWIGDPVDEPRVAVEVVLARGAALADVEAPLREVVEAEVARLPEFRQELIRGEHAVC